MASTNNKKIIIGLGNPGEKYQYTRHNAGFLTVDVIAKNLKASWEFNKKTNSEIATIGDLVLIKPQTFMNNSGQAVQAVLSYFNLLPKKLGIIKIKNLDLSEKIIIIHDDLDIDLGKYKISTDSRAAGHNGVQSVINHLKTKNFTRIRIGIKKTEDNKIPSEKFVLQNFNNEELIIINKIISEVAMEVIKKLEA